ncbi:MAG TPA: hypothetical protein VIV54_03995 [Burkholderiales bacterium]
MDAPLVSMTAGLLGSLIGGSATVATTWVAQKTLGRRELVRDEIRKREALYGEFIAECARLIMDAFLHTLEKPDTLLPIYALVNRIRLTATPAVLAEAERLVARITEQYFSRNLTVDELRAFARSEEADPLRTFGETCRAELESMRLRA